MIVNPGIRRFLGSAIQRLFNSASFYAPLTHSLVLERGTGSPSFTRATTATGQKWDEAGYLDFTALAGEAIFKGARREYNQWTTSSVSLASGANKSLTLAAGTYQFSMGAGTGTATFSGTGGATGTLGASTSGRVSVAKTITAGTFIITASVADLADLQVCNITGETDQTTIRPYVSVGALDYRSEQNPLYLSLPGTAGHYASTPDAAANRFTGDQAIVQRINLPDYTPAATQMLVSGYIGASGAARKFYLNLQTSGVLRFAWVTTAPVDVFVDSTVALATVVSGGSEVVIGVSFDIDNGAAGNDIKLWYSLNNETTWTQLGATVTTAGVAVRNAGTAPIQIGAFDGTSQNAIGNFYSLRLYNGIPPIFGGTGSATPVVDFNPQRDATTPTGTITSSTTGEVWTINGASSVVRNAAYHGSMVDGVKCYDTDRSGNPISTSGSYPLVGYVPWEARTNHFLNSSVPATQTSGALSTGTYTLWMTGTGSVAVAGNTATITGTGTATDGSPVTFVVTVGGTVDYTVTGSPTKAQSENGAYQSPYILTAGAAVARNADVDQYPTTDGPIAAAGSISLDFTPYHAPSGTIALWGTYVDASNYTAILHDATNLIFRKRIAGSNYDATIANAFVSGTTYKVAATWGATSTAIYLDGVAGTPHANTTAAQIAATMQVGADGNSLQQPGAGTTNLRIWQRQLSSPEGVAVTA